MRADQAASGWLLGSCLLLLGPAAAAAAGSPSTVEVRTESMRIAFSLAGGDPIRWEVCHPSCEAPTRVASFAGQADPAPIRIVSDGDAALAERLTALSYRVDRRDAAGAITLAFSSEALAEGVAFEKSWLIATRGYGASLRVAVRGERAREFLRDHPLEVRLTAGAAFRPPGASGLGGLSERASHVYLHGDGVRAPDALEEIAFEKGAWAGLRNRFWALLASADSTGVVSARSDALAVRLPAEPTASLRFYAGPIDPLSLEATDPILGRLPLSQHWFWLRWLSLGMLFLLDGLHRLVRSWGMAVVLLALAVKILMRPLTSLAERWQRDVNEKRSRLQPRIDDVRAHHTGSERSRRLLALHREEGINPFFGLKSLFGVLIQIPIFFAAYHALDEAFALYGAPFLWIRDLARPDRAASLPFAIPFLGDAFNLLPFLMTSVTLLSSRLHDDGSLAPDLLRRQRRGLYAMALAFLLLFYTFPAAMVLYWTSNNLVALAQGVLVRWIASRREWRMEAHGVHRR